jgi:S-adenosylmethionine:tRNA ribosyltransferase-isomerase
MKPTLLSSYDYVLPERLIAQKPAVPRDASRLLVVDRARGTWEHRVFSDLPSYYVLRDVLVANNTQVIKARLLGSRLKEGGELGGRVEFVLLEELEPNVWEGLFHASAKYKPGLIFQIPTPDGLGLRGELVRGAAESAHGTVVARFDRDPVASGAGEIPLPKYIRRASLGEHMRTHTSDEADYQTVYAKTPGSAAAPTAGLHFTDSVLAQLHARGSRWEEVTLNVGLGTFRPVKEEDVSKHVMHEERYQISTEVAQRITAAKNRGDRITAVGTTSVRTLESAWDGHQLRAGAGRTSLFIRPGAFLFKVVDRMVTNFHLPRSTLLMLVCAFAGRELIMDAYAEAVREEYRFFSYGDAMLIL